MRNVNTSVWGTAYTEFDSINQRTGAVDLQDNDYVNYPPFVKSNLSVLGQVGNPTGTPPTIENDAIYIGYLNAPDIWGPGKEMDLSVAYCACKNSDIMICNTGMIGVATDEQTINGSYNYSDDTTKAISVERTGDKITPICFLNSYNYMQYMPNKTLSTTNLNGYGSNPYYSSTTMNAFSWSPDGGISTDADYDTASNRNKINTNAWFSYWRDFGIRALIGVIMVVYFDGTYDNDKGEPQNVNGPVSLHWYETQAEAWRLAHPILGAYEEIYLRTTTAGAYQHSRPTSQTFQPDITINMKLTEKWGNKAGENFWQPISYYYKNSMPFFPLYGAASLGNRITTDLIYYGELGTQSGVYTSKYGSVMVGLNEGELKCGTPRTTSYNSAYKFFWLELEGTTENCEKLRKAAASYGLFFTDGLPNETGYADIFAEGNDTTRWTNENLCLGVVDDEGYTDGTYTRGQANEDANNFDWKTGSESNYDPGRPPSPPEPQPGTGGILPEGLKFTLAGKGTNIYALTGAEIGQVWKDVFGEDIKLTQFGGNPMQAILSLKWTPFTWSSNNNSHLILGSQVVGINHTYPVITSVSDAEVHGWGEAKFTFEKNFYNARYMQARLFLPFYGYYELPAAQLLSSKLRLDFYYDIPDELGVWIISYDDIIYDFCECACDMDVPLTGSNAAALSASRRSEALTIATQVGAMAVAGVVGASGIKAVGAGLGNIIEAGREGAWAFGGSALRAGLANIEPLAAEGLLAGMGKGLAGMGAIGATGIGGIYNTIHNAKVERASLKTNLPYHGSALQTTFLHMSMKPYVQIFKNQIMEGLGRTTNTVSQKLSDGANADYMLKVGNACDVWKNLTEMPAGSLCQTTGIANMDTDGMTMAEVQELNSILQNGFYKSV